MRRVIDDSEWERLQAAVRAELPFPPPFQLRLLSGAVEPASFEADVDYWGDWGDESLRPFCEIEWLRVRPRYLRRRGRLVAPELVSVEPELEALLGKLGIPHENDGEAIWLRGHVAEPEREAAGGGNGGMGGMDDLM